MFRAYSARLAILAVCVIGFVLRSAAVPSTNELNSIVAEFVDGLDPDLKKAIAKLAKEIGVADSVTVSNFLVSVDVKAVTEQQIAALKSDIRKFESRLTEKKRFLANLQQSIELQKQRLDLLRLTPQQLASIERYNQSVSHDPNFSEWIRAHQTWFDVGKDILVGLFLLWVGLRVERWRTEHSRMRWLRFL